MDLPLVAPEGVLVPEHLAADVALHGLLLVRAVYVGLGAQLRAVRADQLDVGLSHVLLQVSLRVKHLSALLTRPVTRRSSRMVVTQMLLQVPKILKKVISLWNIQIDIVLPDFLGADRAQGGLADLLLLAVVLEPQVGPEDLDRLEALTALATVEALLWIYHRLRMLLLPVPRQVCGMLFAQFTCLYLGVDLVHVTSKQGPVLEGLTAKLTRILSRSLFGPRIGVAR